MGNPINPPTPGQIFRNRSKGDHIVVDAVVWDPEIRVASVFVMPCDRDGSNAGEPYRYPATCGDLPGQSWDYIGG